MTTLELIRNMRHNRHMCLEAMNALMERAGSEGRVLTAQEGEAFDWNAKQIEWLDRVINAEIAHGWIIYRHAEPAFGPLRPTPKPPEAPQQPQQPRKRAEPGYLNVYGQVGRLAGELPTHSTLDGGNLEGIHFDVVPFWEMEDTPTPIAPYATMLKRKQRSHAHG